MHKIKEPFFLFFSPAEMVDLRLDTKESFKTVDPVRRGLRRRGRHILYLKFDMKHTGGIQSSGIHCYASGRAYFLSDQKVGKKSWRN